MDSLDPQAYRRREHRFPDFWRAGFSEGSRREIHEDSFHEFFAVRTDGREPQARLFPGTARRQQFQPRKERLETQGSGRTRSGFYWERFRKFSVQLHSERTASRFKRDGRRPRCDFQESLRTGKIYAGAQLAVSSDGRKALGARRSGIPEKVRRDVFLVAAFLKAAHSKITLCRGAGRRHVRFRARG